MEERRQSTASSLSARSPTFSTYSADNLGDIAARVVGELNSSRSDPFDDDFYALLHQHHDDDGCPASQLNGAVRQEKEEEDDKDDGDDESEFEFAVLCREDGLSPISADEIFSNGQIRPMFPVFNTDLVFSDGENYDDESRDPDPPPERKIRLPLRKLLTNERENAPASCSSSEADDLDGIPSGTYCVWTPKKKDKEDMVAKKSHSTGSCSKRFRIRDLLYRSNSDGKETFVFLTPSHHHHHAGAGDHKRRDKIPPAGKKKGGMEEKKKSYLPYRKNLVGFFANVNSISAPFSPFN